MDLPHNDGPSVPDDTPGHWRIEAETSITKEVHKHVLIDPDGHPVAFYSTLGHCFDHLEDAGATGCWLDSGEWRVLVVLSPEEESLTETEIPPHG